jgi:hypothetical protein
MKYPFLGFIPNTMLVSHFPWRMSGWAVSLNCFHYLRRCRFSNGTLGIKKQLLSICICRNYIHIGCKRFSRWGGVSLLFLRPSFMNINAISGKFIHHSVTLNTVTFIRLIIAMKTIVRYLSDDVFSPQ